MNEYDYFIAGFQTLDAEFVRQLIVAQPSLGPTLSAVDTSSATVEGVDGFNISVSFTDPLSDPAQTLLAGLMATYMTSVPVAKMKKLSALNSTAQDYIETRYPLLTRVQLMNLYTLAKFDGLTNRAAYIRPGIDWINEIAAYVVGAAAAIQALTVFADVVNYVVNITANVSANPNKTVAAAIAIVN